MILGRILGKSWTSPPSFEWIAANCCCLSHWRHLVACRWLDWVLQKSGYASNFWVLRDWTTDSWVHAQSPSHLVIEFVFTSPFPSLQRCPLFCPRRPGTAPVSGTHGLPGTEIGGIDDWRPRKLRWGNIDSQKNGLTALRFRDDVKSFPICCTTTFTIKGQKMKNIEKIWKVTFSPPQFPSWKSRDCQWFLHTGNVFSFRCEHFPLQMHCHSTRSTFLASGINGGQAFTRKNSWWSDGAQGSGSEWSTC